ncbi:MAG: hypothetical protein D6758_08225 [Gammaproteobacteria bacterium]|nr:MAG: hypothetical protein D6758_08225 [Gammaproteobacteria bacterium]
MVGELTSGTRKCSFLIWLLISPALYAAEGDVMVALGRHFVIAAPVTASGRLIPVENGLLFKAESTWWGLTWGPFEKEPGDQRTAMDIMEWGLKQIQKNGGKGYQKIKKASLQILVSPVSDGWSAAFSVPEYPDRVYNLATDDRAELMRMLDTLKSWPDQSE